VDGEIIPDDEKDAVSWLQRHAYAMKWELPVYTEGSKIGEDHCPTFTMRCVVGPVDVLADGKNKKIAKQNVARTAMDQIRQVGLLPQAEVETVKTPTQYLQELVQRQGWSVEFPW
jgi:dsRNA-specific ribonuclease